VRWVSWHDAQAWCDWLNETLATSPACAGSPIARLVREQGWRVALPSELEWEKAARGGLGGSVFPWPGDADPNRANYGDSQIGDTSAVGCFAANGFGLFDMVGNVWEWTRSIRLPYPYDPTDPKREDLKAGDDVLSGSCGAARGQSSRPRPLRLPRWDRPGNRLDNARFSGGVAFLPCSLTLASVPLTSVTPGPPTLEGVRGRLPPPRVGLSATRYALLTSFSSSGWRSSSLSSLTSARGGSVLPFS
jgi:hypothetical protein